MRLGLTGIQLKKNVIMERLGVTYEQIVIN